MTEEEAKTLLALADRCEREMPCGAFDEEIFWTIRGTREGSHYGGFPKYTTSLDAAVGLVPEGFVWAADNFSGPCAFVLRGGSAAGDLPEGSSAADGTKTIAAALCAAALRARATIEVAS